MSWVKPSVIAEMVSVSTQTVHIWCNRPDAPLPHKREGGALFELTLMISGSGGIGIIKNPDKE